VDVAEIQEAVTYELKKVQKEEFSAAFQKLCNGTKASIYASGAYFELKKKVCVFLMCLRFLKKSVLKLLNYTVYYHFASFGLNVTNIIKCCLYLSVCQGFGILVMGLVYTKVVEIGY
jgi:MFS-type transporter involved in bile tolerance (Atg22 family)